MDELNADPDIVLTLFLADMIERHHIKGMINIAGRYSCEYCVAEGVTRKGDQRGGGVKWPHDRTAHATLRTHDKFEEIAR